MGLRYGWVLLAVLLGCGAAETAPGAATSSSGGPVDPEGCPAGEEPIGADCVPAGEGAGIAPDGCDPGFEHDGTDGCEPILPERPCGDGEIALIGESECQPLAACGTGTWGDIPTDADTVHVDPTFAGTSDGSAAAPYTTVSEAVANAEDGDLVALAAGSYGEDVVVDRPITLWGRCPEMVEIVGQLDDALYLPPSADGAVVRSLALSGPAFGFWSDAEVEVRELWVHDTGQIGLGFTADATVNRVLVERAGADGLAVAGATLGADAIQLRDGLRFGVSVSAGAIVELSAALIERNRRIALFVEGAELTVAGSVVRDTELYGAPGQNAIGYGLNAQVNQGTGTLAVATVTGSYFAGNAAVGLNLMGGTLTVERTVVQGTLPFATGHGGIGIQLRDSLAARVNELTVRESIVAANRTAGVQLSGGVGTLDRVVLRDTLVDEAEIAAGGQSYGHGATVFVSVDTGRPGALAVSRSLVSGNHEIGVSAIGSSLVIEGTLIQGTLPHPALGLFGRGISVQSSDSAGLPASFSARWNRLEGNVEAALFVIGEVEATIEASAFRATAAGLDGYFGRGVSLEGNVVGPRVTLENCLVEDNHEAGVSVAGGELIVLGGTVRTTAANVEGNFGDGILVGLPLDLAIPSSAMLDGVRIEDNARAGVASFGGVVTLHNCRLSCNAIDLNGETLQGLVPALIDQGGNQCGCSQLGECKLASSGLEPPDPLP